MCSWYLQRGRVEEIMSVLIQTSDSFCCCNSSILFQFVDNNNNNFIFVLKRQ